MTAPSEMYIYKIEIGNTIAVPLVRKLYIEVGRRYTSVSKRLLAFPWESFKIQNTTSLRVPGRRLDVFKIGIKSSPVFLQISFN